MMEEQRHNIAMGLIKHRSALLLERAYPRLADAGIQRGEELPLGNMREILGEDIVQQLINLTDGIIKFVDEDLKSIRKAFEKLRSTLIRLYPKARFLNIDFDNAPEHG